ncbi:hypothetical protein JB92DRAFT_2877006, partial [Gautieria morchelliformis]
MLLLVVFSPPGPARGFVPHFVSLVLTTHSLSPTIPSTLITPPSPSPSLPRTATRSHNQRAAFLSFAPAQHKQGHAHSYAVLH